MIRMILKYKKDLAEMSNPFCFVKYALYLWIYIKIDNYEMLYNNICSAYLLCFNL